MEFNSILHEIELYKSLKRQLKNKAKSSSEVDVEVIREQIIGSSHAGMRTLSPTLV